MSCLSNRSSSSRPIHSGCPDKRESALLTGPSHLTGKRSLHRVSNMQIRLTSLILVLMLSGSAFAGVPMEFGEQSCSMDHSMGDMDCCKVALMPSKDAQTVTARLCCALDCSKEGTAATRGSRFAPQLQLTVISYPPIPQMLLTPHSRNRPSDYSHGPPRRRAWIGAIYVELEMTALTLFQCHIVLESRTRLGLI